MFLHMSSELTNTVERTEVVVTGVFTAHKTIIHTFLRKSRFYYFWVVQESYMSHKIASRASFTSIVS